MLTKVISLLVIMATANAAQPEAKTFKAGNGTEVPYRFAAPEKPEPGKTYPLVVFLHGAGERGTDNKAQLLHGAKDILKGATDFGQPVYLIAPQCPPGQWWAEPKEDRRELADAIGENPLLDAVLALVKETEENHQVDHNRIYITGLSMGGFGTFDMLARAPELWAAGIPICGGGDPETVGKFKDVPVRIFHGDADAVVPPEASRIMFDALSKVEADVELTLYPDVGHDSWTRTYRDPAVIKWMLSQKKSD